MLSSVEVDNHHVLSLVDSYHMLHSADSNRMVYSIGSMLSLVDSNHEELETH